VLGNLDRINLGAVAPASLALNAPVNGTFNLSGSTASFQPETLALQGQANLNVGGGAVTASNIQVARGQWQVLGTASEIQMGQVLPRLPSQLLGTVRDGKFNFSGSLTAITPQTIQGNASGSLQVAAGTVRATNFQLFGGRWQGSLLPMG
jgi:translocation and assembly module TamB